MKILLPHSERKKTGGTQADINNAIYHTKNLLNKRLALEEAGLCHEGDGLMPAHMRYDGVIYRHLDFSTINQAARERYLDGVLVIDPLLGIVAMPEVIPNHKLNFHTKYIVEQSSVNLKKYWQKSIVEELNSYEDFFIDILPQEHGSLIRGHLFDHFLVKDLASSGNVKMQGHNAKALKGELVRFILESEMDTVKEIKKFLKSYNLELENISL